MSTTTDLQNRNLMAGASWKIASCFCFAAINGIVRYLSGGAGMDDVDAMPVNVIIFFQNLLGTLFMLPFIISNGSKALYTDKPLLHLFRVLFAVVGVSLWYWSVHYMPLVQAVALNFTGPIFTVIGAHLFLKEAITTNRLAAIGVCFIGAFMIMRPDKIFWEQETNELGIAALLPLGSAIAFAASKLLSRVLASEGESANSLTFYLLVFMAPLSAIPAMHDWVAPSLTHWPWLAAMGILAAGAHYTLTRCLAVAEVSYIMPFGYSKILMSAVIGYMAFGESPKSITLWIGSLIIFLSVAILSLPEKKLITQTSTG